MTLRRSDTAPRRVLLWLNSREPSARGMLQGVRQYVDQHGPWHVVIRMHADDMPESYLRHWSPDGAIGSLDEQAIRRFADVPIVSTSSRSAAPERLKVYSDPEAAANMLAAYLRQQGLKQFAVMTQSRPPSPAIARRVARFCALTADSGSDTPVLDLAGCESDLSIRLGRVGDWLETLAQPVGLWTTDDHLGWLAIEAANHRGIRVPQELAVVGSNNDHFVCEFCQPPLSSLATDQARIGWSAARLLDRLMDGGDPPTQPWRIPPLRVVSRASSDVSRRDPLIDRALSYIEEHLDAGLTVHDLVAALPASRRTLERRFFDAFGSSPARQLRRARLERAKRLLHGSPRPITEIAAACGYSHLSQLSREIREETGMSPSQFRRHRDDVPHI